MLTPTGRLPVERLAPGMLVLAVSGGAAPFQPVVALRRISYAGGMIRVRAWALDDLTPQEDLLIPPGHALIFKDGNKRKAFEILAEKVSFCGGKQGESEKAADAYCEEFFDKYLPSFFKWIYQIDIKVRTNKKIEFTK